MALEPWIRERLAKSVREPWPAGNVEFCSLLDLVIEQRTCKSFLRHRGQGTTTLLIAAALYAVAEKLCPYAVLMYQTRRQADALADVAGWLAEEAGLSWYRQDKAAELYQGGRIELRSIHEHICGLTARIDGVVVRPSLVLLDLGEVPPGRDLLERLSRAEDSVKRLNSPLSPCGIASVSTR